MIKKLQKVKVRASQMSTWPEALYNHGSGSWLAWANDTAAHYAAIHCPRQRTIAASWDKKKV